MNPDCTVLGLIRTSLMNKETTWHGLAKHHAQINSVHFFFCPNHYRENRYLLFLTENYAALHILHHYLTDALKTVSPSNKAASGMNSEPFVLFGSSFPKDKEYTQVNSTVSSIISSL